jgi:hypothetical protein
VPHRRIRLRRRRPTDARRPTPDVTENLAEHVLARLSDDERQALTQQVLENFVTRRLEYQCACGAAEKFVAAEATLGIGSIGSSQSSQYRSRKRGKRGRLRWPPSVVVDRSTLQ